MSLSRREAVVAIARTAGVTIVEDDAYGLLPASPLPALAARPGVRMLRYWQEVFVDADDGARLE